MLGFYLVCENSEEIFDESISLKFTVPANRILFRNGNHKLFCISPQTCDTKN